jgi:hypothetical protein
MKRRHVSVLLFALLAALSFEPASSARQPAQSSNVANFDIRRSNAAAPAAYRERAAQEAAPDRIAQLVSAQALGRARLQRSFAGLQLIPDPVLDVPEVVGTAHGTGFLRGPGPDRVASLRAFLSDYGDAFGLTSANVDRLEVVADYTNPAGNMSWVELEQRVNGLPVFQGTLRGGFTASGELARTTGLLASGLDEGALPAVPSLTAPEAVVAAATSVGWQVDVAQLTQTAVDSSGRLTFAAAGMADSPMAWLTYFPLGPGVARLAWVTTIAGDPQSYLVLIDAVDGTLLFRKNLTAFQSQPATYAIYASDSPAPLSPTTAVPDSGLQAPAVPRTTMTLVGNELPYTFNTLGWIADGENATLGNNVVAGLDVGSVIRLAPGAARLFDFPYNPAPGLPPPGAAPTDLAAQNGEVTNVFYWTNVFHDRLYLLGFTEAAGNFQEQNFGRGGRAFDNVFAIAQESSGANNANFTTPPDGIFGTMRMYLFTGPNPDRTSSLDQEVMLHELTHGLSDRLHGNASGLVTNMAIGMGEGWSDFYARALLSTADEDVNAYRLRARRRRPQRRGFGEPAARHHHSRGSLDFAHRRHLPAPPHPRGDRDERGVERGACVRQHAGRAVAASRSARSRERLDRRTGLAEHLRRRRARFAGARHRWRSEPRDSAGLDRSRDDTRRSAGPVYRAAPRPECLWNERSVRSRHCHRPGGMPRRSTDTDGLHRLSPGQDGIPVMGVSGSGAGTRKLSPAGDRSVCRHAPRVWPIVQRRCSARHLPRQRSGHERLRHEPRHVDAERAGPVTCRSRDSELADVRSATGRSCGAPLPISRPTD